MNNQFSIAGALEKNFYVANQSRANIVANGLKLKHYFANDTGTTLIKDNDGTWCETPKKSGLSVGVIPKGKDQDSGEYEDSIMTESGREITIEGGDESAELFLNRTDVADHMVTGAVKFGNERTVRAKIISETDLAAGSIHVYTKPSPGDLTEALTVDGNQNIIIGDSGEAARARVDIKDGVVYQTKIITAAEEGIREAVGSRTLYSGTFPVLGLNIPVILTDHFIINGHSSVIIIPKYSSGLSLCGWVGNLVIHGVESDAENVSLAKYRGNFDVDWWNDPISGTTQFLTEISNYNSNIGFTSGSKDLNLFCPIEPEHGMMPQDCGYIVVEYTGAYQVQLYYRFEGAVQNPGNFTKY